VLVHRERLWEFCIVHLLEVPPDVLCVDRKIAVCRDILTYINQESYMQEVCTNLSLENIVNFQHCFTQSFLIPETHPIIN
jgi:hypothetical protein